MRAEPITSRIAEERHQQGDLDDQVDTSLKRCIDATKGAGSSGDLIGHTLLADLLSTVARTSAHTEAPRIQMIAKTLRDEIRLAREQQFIDFQVAIADHWPIHHHLVARAHHQDVIYDDFTRVNESLLPLAHDGRFGTGEQGNAIKNALRPYLLHETDEDVEGYHTHGYNGVRVLSQQEQGNDENEHDRIHEHEDILAYDLDV